MMSTKTYFLAGLIGATAFGALANIPMHGSPSGSTAIVPDVSEIRARRHEELSFDNDLKRLQAMQGRYRENLPRRERKAPALRVRQSSPKRPAPKAKPGVAQTRKRSAQTRG